MAKTSTKTDEKKGSITTKFLEGNIIESVYRGQIVFDSSLDADLERLLRDHPGADWLVDASDATGIDASRRDNAGNAIEIFRKSGGRSIAAVIPSGPIRMVASALSFGFDLKLKIFPTRTEALAYLRSLR